MTNSFSACSEKEKRLDLKAEDLSRTVTTALVSPANPPASYRFTNRPYLKSTYRTGADGLRIVVPEQLKTDIPLVRFEVMSMPDITGLGSYLESGQAIQVRHKEDVGEYRAYKGLAGVLLTGPILFSAYVFAAWALTASIGVTNSFPWSTGPLSNWMIWLASALFLSWFLRFIRGETNPAIVRGG